MWEKIRKADMNKGSSHDLNLAYMSQMKKYMQ